MANQKFMIELSNKSKLEIIDFCQHHGLMGMYYKCPICDENMKLVKCNKSDGFQWQCVVTARGNAHHTRRSLRNGTWFALSKLSIPDILLLTYYWIMDYPKKIVKAEMGIVSNTVVDWYNFCREVCIEALVRSKHQIGGPGNIVEICECKLGKLKFNHGKKMEGDWVFVGVCWKSKQYFLAPLQEDRASEYLLDAIKRKIKPGTVMHSDCWKKYKCSKNKDFKQLTVTQSMVLKDSEEGFQDNIVDRLWKQFKTTLPGRKGRTLEFDSYLAEYIYRRQMPAADNKLFTYFKDITSICKPHSEDIKSEDNIPIAYPEDNEEIEIKNEEDFKDEMQNQEDLKDDALKNELKEEIKLEIVEEFLNEDQETNSEYFSVSETTFKKTKCSITEEIGDGVTVKKRARKDGNLMAENEGQFVIQGIILEEDEKEVNIVSRESYQ